MSQHHDWCEALVIVGVLLAFLWAWPGRVLAQRARVAKFIGVPMARIQSRTCLFPGLSLPGHSFGVMGQDGRTMGYAATAPSGQLSKVSMAIRPGALLEPREPDPLLTAEGTDRLARELIERFWGSVPLSLERLGYRKSEHGSVEASWRTSGPEVRVYALAGRPGSHVTIERGEPQP